MNLSYILPLKWDAGQDATELTPYLHFLALHTDLIVVDGSAPENYQAHKMAWAGSGRHIPPQADLHFLNGKVNGVLTGFREALHEYAIIGDDDVRYTQDQLEKMLRELQEAHLVVPQNYFCPNPWHGQWDSSRSLINRLIFHDYPGTLGIRLSFVNRLGGYDGDVMFENLELIRTVQAAGGAISYRDDLYVRRLPPSSRHFWSQRVRQAYDDGAQPGRRMFFMLLLPLLVLLTCYHALLPAALLLAAIPIAEAGRRKAGGTKVFAPVCSAFAPVWLLERAICTWVALGHMLIYGGIRYGNGMISKAANPVRALKKILELRAPASIPQGASHAEHQAHP